MRFQFYKQRCLSIFFFLLISIFVVNANNVAASNGDGTKMIETKNGKSVQTPDALPRTFNGKHDPRISANPKLAPANFELVMATTGNGFENDLSQHPHGIKSDWVSRIEAFKYSWGWGITGINLLVPWERFEPTPGNYQLAALQKVIDFCDERHLTLSIKFLAQRTETDGFLQPSEYVKGYFRDENPPHAVLSEVFSTVTIPGFRDVYPSYGCDRTNAMIFNAVQKIAEKLNTYSRAGVMSLAGGTTEELANHVFDYSGKRLAGDFSDDNMSRFNQWVISRGLATPGMPELNNGFWPAPKFDTPLGLEFGRFMSYNIGKYQRNFVNAVKSVSNIPVIYVYAAASNAQLKSTANANMNYIAATSDGMYGSEGDGVLDHVAKFRVNSVNLGTKPDGISCVEFDVDDWSTYRYTAPIPGTPPYCDNHFDQTIVKNSMESLYSKGVRYINLTMAFCETEIQGMNATLQQLHQSYIGKPYVRPVINSSNTVSVEVTQKYRAGQDLTAGIDVYNQYTKYTDNDFWGGVSPDGCSTPAPALVATSTNIQSGQPVTITASGCSGTLNWQNGVGSGSSITVSPTTTTTYFVSCTANGCTSATSSITINVSNVSCPPPSLSATSSTIQQGQSTTITASGCSGTVNWTNGLGSGASKVVSPTSPTTYTATCTVNGCTSSPASITINVTPPSGINCTTMQSDFGGADCNNLNGWIYDQSNPNTVINVDIYEGSTLIAGNIPAGNFRQDLLDAGKGNGYHGFVIPTPAALKNGQNRSISMRATGCSYVLSGSPRTINCQGCTAPSAPSLSATSTSITSGQSVTLSASGCSGTITWSHGLGSGSSKTVSPTSPTTYTATCTVNGCTSSPASITISVNQPSSVNCNTLESDFGSAGCNVLSGWVYDQSNPNTVVNFDIYEGSTLIAGNIPAGNFRQDLLNAGKGNGYHGFQIETPAQLKNGQNRTLTLKASGCNYVFTNSPRTINCAPGSRLAAAEENSSVGDEASLVITVAPNPNSGSFEISFYQVSPKALLSVVDETGSTRFKKEVAGRGEHKIKVNLTNASSGTYHVVLDQGNRKKSKKVVVVK